MDLKLDFKIVGTEELRMGSFSISAQRIKGALEGVTC